MSYPEFNVGEIIAFRYEKRFAINSHEAKAVVLREQSTLMKIK